MEEGTWLVGGRGWLSGEQEVGAVCVCRRGGLKFPRRGGVDRGHEVLRLRAEEAVAARSDERQQRRAIVGMQVQRRLLTVQCRRVAHLSRKQWCASAEAVVCWVGEDTQVAVP